MPLRRVSSRLAVTFGLVLLGVPGFVALNLDDPDRRLAEELKLERPDVAPEDNGFPTLQAAAEVLHWPEEDDERLAALADGETWDPGLAAKVLEHNAEALRLFARASRAPGFQTPPFRYIEDDLPDFLPALQLARLSAIGTIARARSDHSDALADALSPVRLGSLVQADRGGTLIHAMIGVALKDIGLGGAAAALPHLSVSAADSLAWESTAMELHTDPEDWRQMWIAEYQVMARSVFVDEDDPDRRRSLLEVAEALGWETSPLMRWVPATYAYKPNATWRAYGELIRKHIAAAGRPCADLPEPSPAPRYPLDHPLTFLRPNGIGTDGLHRASRTLQRYELRRCRSDSRLAVTVALVALRAYEADHGRPPPALADLVPDYLRETPRDDFTGQALHYSAEQRLIRAGTDEERVVAQEDEGADPGNGSFAMRF